VHIDPDALAQMDSFEVFAIGAQRLLRIRPGVGVIEKCAGNSPARDGAKILDARSFFQRIERGKNPPR
jgi:hypothetical protein